MSNWMLIAGAVASNVVANVALKSTMSSAEAPENVVAFARQAITTPSFWIFGFSAALLLGFYALSLRTFDLSTVYALVTSLALVGVTLSSAWLFGDSLTLPKIAGSCLIILGIILVTRS